MARVYRRAVARRDLIDHYVYLAENAGAATAERFLSQAETSFNSLAEYPEMGVPLKLSHAKLAGLRKWQVPEFDKVLVFYFPRHDGVTILRVLHAAQDWWRLLGVVDRRPGSPL